MANYPCPAESTPPVIGVETVIDALRGGSLGSPGEPDNASSEPEATKAVQSDIDLATERIRRILKPVCYADVALHPAWQLAMDALNKGANSLDSPADLALYTQAENTGFALEALRMEEGSNSPAVPAYVGYAKIELDKMAQIMGIQLPEPSDEPQSL